MKKLFIFLTMLVVGIGSSWAVDLTLTPSNGTYVTSSSNYVNSITFSTTPSITVTASANNMDKRQTATYLLWHSGSSGSSTYTLTVPNSSCIITSYTVTGEANKSAQTLTAGSETHEFAVGTSSSFTVTGLNSSSVSFVLTGDNSSGLKITSINVTVKDWTTSIPDGAFVTIGDKVSSFTAATDKNDNKHWYILTQIRGGETPMYNTATGSGIKRTGTNITTATINEKLATSDLKYLIRFIETETGIYNIQFADGDFITSSLTTTPNLSNAGKYAFYNCNGGSGSYFAWNKDSKSGQKVDNNGAGNTLAFWESGETSGNSGNNVWYMYPVNIASDFTVDCSSSVVKMTAQGGTNPAVFYNTSENAQSGSAWYPKYITNTKIPVTIDCGTDTRLSNYSGYINAYGTVTMNISVPTSYRIKSYSFEAQITNSAGTNATAQPAGGSTVDIDGSSAAEVSASNVNSSKTSITFTGEASSGTECLISFSNFTVVIEEIPSLSQSYGEEATVVINGTTGTFSRSDGGTSTWTNQWDADDSYLPLSLRITSDNGNTSYSYDAQNIDNISFNVACGYYGATYTLTAPDGYLIKDYTLTVMASATAQTITPKYPSQLSGTSVAANITSPVTLKVKRVYDKKAQIDITGTNGSLKTTNFIVTLVKDGYTPDNQIYQIVCKRAGLAVASGGNTLSSTSADELNLALDGSDLKQQFAFVKNAGKIYLYSIGEQKFVTKTKALKTYIGDPITIFPTGNSEYPYGFKFNDEKVINHNSSVVSIEAYGGTTTGTLDDGNRFKLNGQGNYTSMSDAEAKLNSIIYNLNDIDQTTAYTISTNERGNWYVPSSAKAVTSTLADEVEPSSDDPKQQFAFVKDVENISDNYYLYSVSEKKFITVGELEGATGELQFNRALLGAPDLNQNVTFVASTNSVIYPTVVTVNGRNLGISPSYTPMVIDYQSTADEGNNALIVPAIDNFDPSEAQLILLQLHALELYNTAGNLGYPGRDADVTKTLLNQAVNPTDYATLRSAYNAYKEYTDIIKPAANTFLRINSVLGANASLKAVDGGSRMIFSTTRDVETIFLYDGSHLISYSKGLTVNNVRDMGSVGTVGNEFTFVKALNGNLGQFSVKCTDESSYKDNYLYSTGANNSNADRNTYADNYVNQNSFTLEPVTSLPVTFNSTALGYATFNSPVALIVPKDKVKAYVCKIEGNTIKMYYADQLKDGDNWVLPENTPVLLYNSDYTNTPTVNLTITSDTDEEYENNGFNKGTVAAETPDADNYIYYALRKLKSGTVGFYQRADQTAALTGFRAWIAVPKTSGARNFTIEFDGDSDPTGIVEALGLEDANVEIYDLNGRKLSEYRKGINIVNGKKVFK